MNIYTEWGFTQPVFGTASLPPNEIGELLLVGRDTELTALTRRIFNPPKIVTIEGLNGVGKTSLVNVAAYKASKRYDGNAPLYVPCTQNFQLHPDKNASAFVDEVVMAVAQTLISNVKTLPKFKGSDKLKALDAWLNETHLRSYNAGIPVFSLGESAETNTSAGFERSGLKKMVFDCLQEIFPSMESGGVVCVIDNLELLESSKKARAMLEALRDEILTIQGLRWVLCGALGIVLGVASSPRLEGWLHTPIEVESFSDDLVKRVLSSRISAFSSGEGFYLPLLEGDFEDLYEILNRNLRSVLSKADDYCQWAADRPLPTTTSDKKRYFQEWLKEQSDRAYLAFKSKLRTRAIELFDIAVERGGVFAPSDYEEFGFNSVEAIRPHVKDLEEAGVLVSTQDDGDKRRKTIQVTPLGWLVHYSRSKDVATSN
ncbi:ATP-binding protein [Geobacter sp. AOG2]|uniref:ATP-binding protein n=1 Tax=Geobacter sp. AOG2 TaxID=1566347 RepID=UPI001CC5F68B|nr:ATP-binding protein [Geobacter sp. AOG2]GFE60624.1 hypothetical protein AOG2_12120 [Geobacter sp. AOG2]